MFINQINFQLSVNLGYGRLRPLQLYHILKVLDINDILVEFVQVKDTIGFRTSCVVLLSLRLAILFRMF